MNPQEQNESKKFQLIDSRLSDLQKGKLFAFCQDVEMVNAVEKVITYALYMMGTVQDTDTVLMDVNWVFGLVRPGARDEEIGREAKARLVGLTYLDDAFKQIKKFGVEQVKEKKASANKAR